MSEQNRNDGNKANEGDSYEFTLPDGSIPLVRQLRAQRLELQSELATLLERLANSGVEMRRAVAEERERCAEEIAMLRRLVRSYEHQAHLSVNDLEFGA